MGFGLVHALQHFGFEWLAARVWDLAVLPRRVGLWGVPDEYAGIWGPRMSWSRLAMTWNTMADMWDVKVASCDSKICPCPWRAR